MTHKRHSYVEFYPSDWLAGTSRMTRLQRSFLFDICCYIWDKAADVPAAELPLMFGDIEDWTTIIDNLVASGKLYRNSDGSVGNVRAMAQAKKAYELWRRKSRGGKAGADARWNVASESQENQVSQGTPNGNALGDPMQNQNQNHIQNQKIMSDWNPCPDLDEAFRDFWQAYPSRNPHPNPEMTARREFEAAVGRGIEPHEIIDGARRYAEYSRSEKIDPLYIKQTVTWLRDEGWREPHTPRRRPPLVL
ncbi:MAG: YdaU family protein [Alphaproteobacteria bacterium]|nr:YdaU family protein [Alphaproteobacteria bacterium]